MRQKDESIDQSNLQYSPNSDKHICAKCVDDESLAKVVQNNLESNRCDYCNSFSNKQIAASLNTILAHIAKCIDSVYQDPVHKLSCNSEEGGYQGETFNINELLDEVDYQPENDELRNDIEEVFCTSEWCKQNYNTLSLYEHLAYGWTEFVQTIQHQRRFTFWSMNDPKQDLKIENPLNNTSPGIMLDKIASCVHKTNLLRELPTSTAIWRVRVHDRSTKLTSPTDFTAPPAHLATQPNRMSPAGIPMFYGAEDWTTACDETVDPSDTKDKQVSGVCFFPVRPLWILDLLNIPPIPSFWDIESHGQRDILLFLHGFEKDLSKPIMPKHSNIIEYVPTQVFSEYVRYHLKTNKDSPIDGIRYRSSKNGKACYVIFCEQDYCLDKSRDQQRLRCDKNSFRSAKSGRPASV